MPLDRPTLAIARKVPRQARAKETVAAILEAAARILERHGEAELNTASVARLAGCSIGTLYQYFGDRDEILMALVDLEHQRIVERARELMKGLDPGQRPAATRELVRVFIASYAARRGARRQFELLMNASNSKGKPPLASAFAEAIVKRVGGSDELQKIARARAFVMTRAMVGVLRAAALESDTIIKDPAFEDALCLMVDALQPPDEMPLASRAKASLGGIVKAAQDGPEERQRRKPRLPATNPRCPATKPR